MAEDPSVSVQSRPNVASMQSDLGRVPNDLANMQRDVYTTYKDEHAVLLEAQQHRDGNYGGVCADASGVAADASGVQADQSGIAADGSGMDADYQGVGQDQAVLAADAQRLWAAEAALPDYQPAGLPTRGDVSRANNSASSAIKSAKSTFAGYVKKAQQMVDTANGYAKGAQDACTKVGGRVPVNVATRTVVRGV